MGLSKMFDVATRDSDCPKEYRDRFEQFVPSGFQADLCSSLVEIYEKAYRESYELFPPEQAHDFLPIYRRSLIEARLQLLARRYGLEATSYKNKADNCFHVRISAGELVLTISGLPNKNVMVRQADFRAMLARDNQLFLFPEFERVLAAGEHKVYGLIVHGPNPTRTKPAFVQVVFPNQELTKYLGRIDLLALFAPAQTTEEEQIADEAFPSPRQMPSIEEL